MTAYRCKKCGFMKLYNSDKCDHTVVEPDGTKTTCDGVMKPTPPRSYSFAPMEVDE